MKYDAREWQCIDIHLQQKLFPTYQHVLKMLYDERGILLNINAWFKLDILVLKNRFVSYNFHTNEILQKCNIYRNENMILFGVSLLYHFTWNYSIL